MPGWVNCILVDAYLALVLHDDLRDAIIGGDQSGDGHVLSQEVALGPPGELACDATGQDYGKDLVGIVSAEEEQVVVGIPVVPGGANPAVDHGHLAQVVIGVEGRDGVDPVPVAVGPAVVGIPW